MTGLPASIIKKYGVTKKAWSVFRGRHKSKGHAPKTKHHGGMRKMTRRGRKHHGGGHGLMQSAEKLGTLAAFIAPAAITLYEYRSTQDHGLKALVARYTPYDPDRGFNLGGMAYGWGPVVSFKLAAMAYHKIMGLLRRA